MRRADIEVPNHAVDMDSWARSACYPRGTFYPLSDGHSTMYRRITSPDFRPCSTCQSHSQAPLCTCTRHLIANQAEGTFGRLRYILGGGRPSQTTRQARSPELILQVRNPSFSGWYFTVASTEPSGPASKAPTYPTQSNPSVTVKL